jgi:hypothetical protein
MWCSSSYCGTHFKLKKFFGRRLAGECSTFRSSVIIFYLNKECSKFGVGMLRRECSTFRSSVIIFYLNKECSKFGARYVEEGAI